MSASKWAQNHRRHDSAHSTVKMIRDCKYLMLIKFGRTPKQTTDDSFCHGQNMTVSRVKFIALRISNNI